jgi:hypothetical protein
LLPHHLFRAIESGERFLLEQQEEDGAWRDYCLEPGRSEAWTTAIVAVALGTHPVKKGSCGALLRSSDFLHRIHRVGGWGYNRHTATDGDSTAWSLTFLVGIGDIRELEPVGEVTRYMDADGGMHTYTDRERFGSWAQEHSEVTAVAGSLLTRLKVADGLIHLVCKRCLDTRSPSADHWPGFWWTTGAYATAHSLGFLRRAGGLGVEVAAAVADWVVAQSPGAETAFDVAHLGLAAVHLGLTNLSQALGEILLASQASDGGWGPSETLVVPAQHRPSQQTAVDDRRQMTTAVAVSSLKAMVRALGLG